MCNCDPEICRNMLDNQNSHSFSSLSPKRVVMFAFEGASSMDIVGPIDVLSAAQVVTQSTDKLYEVEIVSLHGGLIVTKPANVAIDTVSLAEVSDGEIDILLVAGGENALQRSKDSDLRAAIKLLASRSTYVASICNGIFFLAEAGLLENRTVTTHWAWTAELAAGFPDLKIEADKIYVQDGNIFTSAGVTAGLDLALALIQLNYGKLVALSVAKYWVMFLKRPGGQSQFSSLLPNSNSISTPIEKAIVWARNNLHSDLNVYSMAEQVYMSPRNFHRRFTREVGSTPTKYVETLRLHKAKSHLELSDKSLEEIARETGFSSADRMRRSFIRSFNVSPSDYRERNR